MKESVGYTVTLNIAITFIIIVFAFLSATLIYFKSNKVSNIIVNSIEKYEGYNHHAESQVLRGLSAIGYNIKSIESSCTSRAVIDDTNDTGNRGVKCELTSDSSGRGKNGYCVYLCTDTNEEYYYYRVRTNMMFNVPIINNLLDIPIYSNTNRLYDFYNVFKEEAGV